MKTAISIPDQLFEVAENTASQMGLARSQLYTKAIQEFIEHHRRDTVTEKLNAIYGQRKNIEEVSDTGLEALRETTQNDSW